MTQRRSRTETEIPLHLLPHAVARKIREYGDAIYRVSMKRTHWHHFNVTVRTKPVKKELAPRNVAVIAPEQPAPAGKRERAGRREVAI